MSDSVYGGGATFRATVQPGAQTSVVLSDTENDNNQSDSSEYESDGGSGILGANASFFGGEDDDSSRDSYGDGAEYWSSSAAEMEAGAPLHRALGATEEDLTADDDEYEDLARAVRYKGVEERGSDDEEKVARAVIGVGESFGSYDGAAESDDDSDSLDEQAYQFTLLGDGLYYVWNVDTGQAFMLAHETRPEIAFCRSLDAEEASVRQDLAAPEAIDGDEARALVGFESHEKAVVPGILGFFVERVLRRGERSERKATFLLGSGESAVSGTYETPQSAEEESIGGEPGTTNYQLVQKFVRADEDEAVSIFGTRAPTVRDAIVGLRNHGGRDTWQNERRHGALLDALCGEGSLREYYAADDAHRLGHLRRFDARGDTCYARDDAVQNTAQTTSVSPVTATDSAWFVLAPTYYALYRAHCRLRDASQTLLVRMRSNPSEVAHSAVPRQNGIAVEPIVTQIAKQASQREMQLASKRQLATAHMERVLDRLCGAKPRIERLAANIGALGAHVATSTAGPSAFIDALTALVGFGGAKALMGAERVDPENELAHTLRDVVDLLGDCEELRKNLRACRDEEATEWFEEYSGDKDDK